LGCRVLVMAVAGAAALLAPCVVADLAGSAKGGGTYRISGKIVCGIFGFGIPDVKLYGLPGDPKTDGDGRYSVLVPEGWSGAVYPLRDLLHFDPFGRNYVNVSADITDNYKTTLPVPAISGYVRTAAGDPIDCVSMVGLPNTPMTNYHGFYLAYVKSGSDRTVTPQKPSYVFTPPSRVHTGVDSDLKNQNYTGTSVGGIVVSPTSGLTTTEGGGTAQFAVVLTSAPTANVAIGLSSSDPTEGSVSPTQLTFTPANWNVPQTVTVTGLDDDLRDGHVAYTIITAPAVSGDALFDGKNPSDVSVTNRDDDSPGITVSPTSGLVTTEGGGTAQFTVVLDGRSTADVTVPLSSSDPTEGVADTAAVTFTPANWNTPQVVTITGLDDLEFDGDISYTILTGAATSADAGYNGLNAADVSVTNKDDDAPPLLLISAPKKLDFGGVEIGQSAELDAFTVTNAGGGRLTGGASISGDFAIVSGSAFSLLPGESQSLRLRFVPTAAGKRKATLNFLSNGGTGKRPIQGVGNPHTVVVDNRDNEADKRFETLSGVWQAEGTQTKFWATDYCITPTGPGNAVAAWHFRVAYDAVYEVSVWWPKALKTWGADVPFRTYHAKGNTVVAARQNSKGGKWVPLGKYEFGPGTDWRVEIANNALGTHVVADAIQVKWVAPLPMPKEPEEPLSIFVMPSRGPAPLDIIVDALGAPADATCLWDFGDGSKKIKSKGTMALHTYYSPGEYTITVTVGDATAKAIVQVE